MERLTLSKGQLTQSLAHVLWIGGPPDAGKTTIAQLIGEKHDLPVYHFDRQEMDHIRRADSARHPALFALQRSLETLDHREWLDDHWVTRPVAEMAQSAIACWTERVDLAVEDLRAMPADQTIVAEGPGFFPEAILPLLSTPHQAIWLLPTETFKRTSHRQRDKTAFRHETSDPDQAYRNHVARDLLMIEHYRRIVLAGGLPYIDVDGSRTAAEVAAAVEQHFGLDAS